MGDIKGFMKFSRQEYKKQPIEARLKNYKEFIELPAEKELRDQGARCRPLDHATIRTTALRGVVGMTGPALCRGAFRCKCRGNSLESKPSWAL